MRSYLELPYWDALTIAEEAAAQRDLPPPPQAPGYRSVVGGERHDR